MPLDLPLVTDLNAALDDATVESLRWDAPSARVELVLRVLGVPGLRIADPDAEPELRYVLTFSPASELRILLRRDRFGTIPYGPPIPLEDAEAVADFLDSLAFSGSMFGGRAIDDASPTDDWPASDSLAVAFPGGGEGRHCLYWFTDCGREEPGGTVGYRLEGLVRFTHLAIRHTDGAQVDLREFADVGVRRWTARHGAAAPGAVGTAGGLLDFDPFG